MTTRQLLPIYRIVTVNKATLTPFAKGVCGNPNGRPKGTLSFRTIMAKIFETPITDQHRKMFKIPEGVKVNNYELLGISLWRKATERGDTKAAEIILDRFEGKAPQVVLQANVDVSEADILDTWKQQLGINELPNTINVTESIQHTFPVPTEMGAGHEPIQDLA